MASFVHLRVKSAYSLLEGAVRPKELAALARESGIPAAAVTDTNNLFGVFEISETLTKAGIQPIVGTLLSVEFAPRSPLQTGSRRKPPHLPLLVQNEAGYLNLTRLLSSAYLDVEAGDWAHVKAVPQRGADRPDRRAGRGHQPASAGRPEGRGPGRAGAAGGGLSRSAVCRTAAARPARGARRRGRADRPGL